MRIIWLWIVILYLLLAFIIRDPLWFLQIKSYTEHERLLLIIIFIIIEIFCTIPFLPDEE